VKPGFNCWEGCTAGCFTVQSASSFSISLSSPGGKVSLNRDNDICRKEVAFVEVDEIVALNPVDVFILFAPAVWIVAAIDDIENSRSAMPLRRRSGALCRHESVLREVYLLLAKLRR